MSEAGRSDSPFLSDSELFSDDSPKGKSKGKKKLACTKIPLEIAPEAYSCTLSDEDDFNLKRKRVSRGPHSIPVAHHLYDIH